jgi:hypothetical protein
MRCVRVFFVLYAVSSYPTDFWVSIICGTRGITYNIVIEILICI